MSLLSSFIRNQLLKAIEEQFVNNEPEIQEEIVKQVEEFAAECIEWVNNKLNGIMDDEPAQGEQE